MISRFHHKGVEVRQAWGMTETSPLGLSAALKPKHRLLPAEDRLALECKQGRPVRSEEHTSELQSLMRSSYAVFCMKKKIRKLLVYKTKLLNTLNYAILND